MSPVHVPRARAVLRHQETSPASYRARYDAEVAAVDAHVGALVEMLRRHRLWDGTLFVLTADHGESLGEHGYYFAHGWYVSDESIRVPLVLRGPGVPRGRRLRQTVSLIDVAPTLLDLLGLPPSSTMEGRSLRGLLTGDAADGEAFSQTYYGEGLVSYRSGHMKYVFKPVRADGPRAPSDPPFPDASAEWLYDLDADPAEQQNLVEIAHRRRGRDARASPGVAPRAGGTWSRSLGRAAARRQHAAARAGRSAARAPAPRARLSGLSTRHSPAWQSVHCMVSSESPMSSGCLNGSPPGWHRHLDFAGVALADDLVARRALPAHDLAVGALVLAVVAAHAARERHVADVGRICVPARLHRRGRSSRGRSA